MRRSLVFTMRLEPRCWCFGLVFIDGVRFICGPLHLSAGFA